MRRLTTMAALAGLVGASMFLGAPGVARADQGKWWTPRSSAGVERRVEGRGGRAWSRQWRPWRGGRVYRDVIVIRRGDRGPGYRAWRYYAYPDYRFRRHLVYVRPVRFFVGAAGSLGGLHAGARLHDPGDRFYGCNFCDARFGDYATYRAHLGICPHRPAGYRIEARDWNDRDWSDGAWWDDRHWNDDDGHDD